MHNNLTNLKTRYEHHSLLTQTFNLFFDFSFCKPRYHWQSRTLAHTNRWRVRRSTLASFVLVAGMEDNIGNSLIPEDIGVLIDSERPLRAIKVKGNGNSLYNALSHLLNGKCEVEYWPSFRIETKSRNLDTWNFVNFFVDFWKCSKQPNKFYSLFF